MNEGSTDQAVGGLRERLRARRREGSSAGLLWLGVVAVVAVAVIYFVAVRHFVPEANRGTFGDAFGALTSVFSGLAFAGLIYTINLQRRELQLQREVMEQSAEAQEDLVKQQRSSSTILGVAAIVQGRYQVAEVHARAPGMDPREWVDLYVAPMEKQLVELMQEEGAELGVYEPIPKRTSRSGS